MTETLEEIGANDFLTLAKTANMMEMLDQNVTLFVPTNEAMQEFMVELEMEVSVTKEEEEKVEVVGGRWQKREASIVISVSFVLWLWLSG